MFEERSQDLAHTERSNSWQGESKSLTTLRRHALFVQVGLNSLADWTHQEYKQHALGYRPDLKMGLTSSANSGFMYANTTAKKSVDWREEGAVTEVKNQGQVTIFQYSSLKFLRWLKETNFNRPFGGRKSQ
jgi:hypothetical protein